MENIYAYIRRHWVAFLIGAGVLCSYGYLTFGGRECFNCQQTESYQSGQRHGSGPRYLHK